MTKFELPKVEDLKLTAISYDSNCQYLDNAMNLKNYQTEFLQDIKNYCVKKSSLYRLLQDTNRLL